MGIGKKCMAWVTSRHNTLLKCLLLIGIFFFILLVFRQKNPRKEGFQQNDKFVLKKDGDIYDLFYAEIYDVLMQQERPDMIPTVLKSTLLSSDSKILDIESKTGTLVQTLRNMGYDAIGLDDSPDMVAFANDKMAGCSICGSSDQPMTFDRSTFTHIVCGKETIYTMQDKAAFFQNCYFWLLPNGFLILHLMHREMIGKIVPKTRQFSACTYKSRYEELGNVVLKKETFVDSASDKIRQNEQTLYMDSVENILRIAQYNGFMLYGKSSVDYLTGGGEFESLYVLQKPL